MNTKMCRHRPHLKVRKSVPRATRLGQLESIHIDLEYAERLLSVK